jgi:hypothetical protein
MGKYVVVYRGGSMGETPGEREDLMKQWMEWFGTLGSTLKDIGNPFSASTAISADGSRGVTSSGLTGYSIIEAANMNDAAKLVADCPHLASGGSLEIYEAVLM